MKTINIFNDVIDGLKEKGWKVQGGGNVICFLEKDDVRIKVFLSDYKDKESPIRIVKTN